MVIFVEKNVKTVENIIQQMVFVTVLMDIMVFCVTKSSRHNGGKYNTTDGICECINGYNDDYCLNKY